MTRAALERLSAEEHLHSSVLSGDSLFSCSAAAAHLPRRETALPWKCQVTAFVAVGLQKTEVVSASGNLPDAGPG